LDFLDKKQLSEVQNVPPSAAFAIPGAKNFGWKKRQGYRVRFFEGCLIF
jgi:hypothetical protein